MKLLRLKPGHGEIVLAEGDVEAPEQERELIEAFRRELDAGMWAAVPLQSRDGRCSTWNAHSYPHPFHVKRVGRKDP